MKTTKTFRGFTLIELLVVIAIIAILAALLLNTAGYIQKKGAKARTEAEIAALSAALESYKADNGDYPVGTATSANSAILYTNLSPTSGKVYFEFNKSMIDTSQNVIDPIGNKYRYQYPGLATRNGTNFFDLWSVAGGETKTNDWVTNW